jgi:hypothetical protein
MPLIAANKLNAQGYESCSFSLSSQNFSNVHLQVILKSAGCILADVTGKIG